jgi:hypothetical protein
MRTVLLSFLLAIALAGCAQETGRLDADQERRLAAEGIARRANNLIFHHTRGGGARWEERRASIVVTRGTVLIHRNGDVEFLYAPSSRRRCEVHRDHTRVRISAGSGRSAEVWSFEPPDDPEGWTADIRSALRGE